MAVGWGDDGGGGYVYVSVRNREMTDRIIGKKTEK